MVAVLVPAGRASCHATAVSTSQRLHEALRYSTGEHFKCRVESGTPCAAVIDILVAVGVTIWKVGLVVLPSDVLAAEFGVYHLGKLRAKRFTDDDDFFSLEPSGNVLHSLWIFEEPRAQVPLEGWLTFGQTLERVRDR